MAIWVGTPGSGNLDLNGHTLTIAGLTSTGAVGAPDGLVGTPGLTFKDDLDNGFFRLSANRWAAVAAGARSLTFEAAGAITNPLQPAFFARREAAYANVTGAGLLINPVIFDAELFHNAAEYDPATGIYTAGVAGKRHFNVSIYYSDTTAQLAPMTQGIITIVVTVANYPHNFNPTPGATLGGGTSGGTEHASLEVNMAVGDTARVRFVINNGVGNTVDIAASTTEFVTVFSGFLIA